jgi:hypothetical protein
MICIIVKVNNKDVRNALRGMLIIYEKSIRKYQYFRNNESFQFSASYY